MLGFTHGGVKNRFQPRPLTPSDVTDGRCVSCRVGCRVATPARGQPGSARATLGQHARAARCSPAARCRRRHFLIPLVCAERAWAHAMELKTASRGENARKRHHAIKRLSKAAAWAAQLASLAAARSDARTALEAEAYASWMARAPPAA